MPAFIVHGFIGYLVYGKMGFYLGILPDIIGFGPYFLRAFYNHLFYEDDMLKKLMEQKSPKAGLEYMNETDWLLYNITHSIFFWGLIYLIFKKRFIFGAIMSILLDVVLHSSTDGWPGPKYLYPLSDTTFDGISWNSRLGLFITTIIVLFYLLRK